MGEDGERKENVAQRIQGEAFYFKGDLTMDTELKPLEKLGEKLRSLDHSAGSSQELSEGYRSIAYGAIKLCEELEAKVEAYRKVALKYIPISTAVMAIESVDSQAQKLIEGKVK